MILGVLIVGLGAIGMGYDLDLDSRYIMTHARAAEQNDKYRLLGGVDPSHEKRVAFGLAYRAPVFSTIEEALKATRPDLIVISVPTEEHLSLIERALLFYRPKAVLCEKPLAYTVSQAKKIVALCEDNEVALYVNYMRRSDPGVIEIKRRFKEKEIVTPVKGVVWYSKGFLHNGSHFFNLLSYWLGPMQNVRLIRSIDCRDVEDVELDISIQFELGEVCFLSQPEESFTLYSLELLAPNGRLRYEQAGKEILWSNVIKDKVFSGVRSLSSDAECISNRMEQFQYNVFEQIACSLEGRSAYVSTGVDALETIEQLTNIMDIVRNSNGREVSTFWRSKDFGLPA